MGRGSWAPRGVSAGCEREQQVCACLRAGWEGGSEEGRDPQRMGKGVGGCIHRQWGRRKMGR